MNNYAVVANPALTKRELAIMYSPDVPPSSALKNLNRWIDYHPTLAQELSRMGMEKKRRYLTPAQVDLILRTLGEPS